MTRIDAMKPTISGYIRTARRAQGKSLENLAYMLGVTINQIYELENGRGGMEILARAADALSIEWTGLPRGDTMGARCRAARSQRGWSQQVLAEKAKISRPAITRLEKDRAHIATLEAVLAILAPGLRISNAVYKQTTSLRDVRFTPPEFVAQVRDVIGPIDLDPAGQEGDHVAARRRYKKEDDGLKQTWAADTIFCNPPYSLGDTFLRRAFDAYRDGEAKLILLLIPARTHTRTFQQIAPHADVLLLAGRIKFWSDKGPLENTAPFPLAIVLFGASPAIVAKAIEMWPAIHIRPTNTDAINRQSATSKIIPDNHMLSSTGSRNVSGTSAKSKINKK